MMKLASGSVLMVVLCAAMLPPTVVTLIAAILAFINVVVWIVTAPNNDIADDYLHGRFYLPREGESHEDD